MKRLMVSIALFAAAASPIAAQQQFPTLEKGFQAGKVYHYDNLDSVNVFNGNLVIGLPIGTSYALNGGLDYQLSLSYNSKAWDLIDAGAGKVHAVPSRRSNAGIGWLLGMGRYIAPDDPSNGSNYHIYESPDGADHRFDRASTGICADGSCPGTTDGSNLRLRTIGTSAVEIDFPDGSVRRFEKNGTEWHLVKITAPRGTDNVTITRGTGTTSACPNASSTWTIADSRGRTHDVCFKNWNVDGTPRPMIDRVVLLSPAGTAEYVFHYVMATNLNAPPEDNDHSNTWTRTHSGPQLVKIDLPSTSAVDDPKFEFTYGHSGVEVTSMTLPTLGKISYQYDSYLIPPLNYCANQSNDVTYIFGGQTTGVYKRTFTPAVPQGQTATSSTWTYKSERRQRTANWSAYISVEDCAAGTGATPVHPELFDEFVVTVVDPNGHEVVNHFSVWPGDLGRSDPETSPAGAKRQHYSRPYGEQNGNLFLSQEFYERAANGTLTLKRRTWVRHDIDPTGVIGPNEPQAPSRPAEQRTDYVDDTGCNGLCSTSSKNEDWDGYGHYRKTTNSGNLTANGAQQSRSSFTSWNWNASSNSARRILPSQKWVLNTFNDVTISDGTTTSIQQSCFDTTDGFLKAYRLLAGATPGVNDYLTVYGKDSAGNFISEKHYGGDVVPLSSSLSTNLCTAADSLANVTPRFAMNHTWEHGRPAKSQYTNTTYYTVDATIGLSGAVLSARDTAGVETTFQYDRHGRVTKVSPGGGAEVTYAYEAARASNGALTAPARVVETVHSAAAGTVRREYQYDSFGRLWREKREAPSADGTSLIWTIRETKFDALGRTSSVSEVVALPSSGSELAFAPSPVTTFTYDSLGRKLSVAAPDNSTTSWTYQGARKSVRTSSGGGHRASPLQISVTETYDSFGQLVAVTEPAGAQGAQVTTAYTYDVGGRLSAVRMDGGATVQNRVFNYDGRGLLMWETQPESGMITYKYDARGLTHTRERSAAQTHFDQKFAYDSAERLLSISTRDPLDSSQYRPLKVYGYAVQNEPATATEPTDYAQGKLRHATRYNYLPQEYLGLPDPTNLFLQEIRVKETYSYRDSGGRRSSRRTEIQNVAFGALQTHRTIDQKVVYNDLGLPSSVTYPACYQCGAPAAGPARVIASTYTNGALYKLNEFVDKITYWPNGMRNQVVHQNGIADTQTLDPSGMPRPNSLSSALYNSCTAPKIAQASTGGVIDANNSAVTLSVVATGSAPMTYQWYEAGAALQGQTSSSITVQPTQSTDYVVKINNACGKEVSSATMWVEVGNCVPPWLASSNGTKNADGTYSLTAAAQGSATLTYTWTRQSDNSVVGTGTNVQVPAPNGIVTYVVTVTNSCGGPAATANVAVGEKPALATPTNFSAVWTGTTAITLSWNASPGATGYAIERRAASNREWVLIHTHNTNSWVDTNVSANAAYAYRVRAVRSTDNGQSALSPVDLVVTMSFTNISSGMQASSTHFTELLNALNAVRAAAGWSVVTWSTILSPGEPVPAPTTAILAKHVVALRARLNEAIHALGVAVSGYGDPDPHLKSITAQHLRDLQGRVQ